MAKLCTQHSVGCSRSSRRGMAHGPALDPYLYTPGGLSCVCFLHTLVGIRCGGFWCVHDDSIGLDTQGKPFTLRRASERKLSRYNRPVRGCTPPSVGGLILFCIGTSMVTNSCDRLIFTLALAALLGAKADREDQALSQLHPLSFAMYSSRTERKFIPYVM